jgi:hypothetical protein
VFPGRSSAPTDEALVGFEPPCPGAIDHRPQPAHLPFVAIGLSGAQARHCVEEFLVEGNLLSPDLRTV